MQWVDVEVPQSITPVQAVALLQQAVSRHPTVASLQGQLGRALAQLERYEDAVEALCRAVALEPTQAEAWFALGKNYAMLGRFVAAHEALVQATQYASGHAEAYSALGTTLEALGRLDEALSAYRHALALDPHNRMACERLAMHLWDCTDAQALLAWCDHLWQCGGYSTQLMATRLLLLDKLGRHAERQALLGLDRFLSLDSLTPPDGYSSLAAFNAALHSSLKHNPALRYAEVQKATRAGWRTDYVRPYGETCLSLLLGQIRQAISRYVAALSAWGEHPFVQARPARAQLSSWAVLLHANGYEIPHLHLDGWLSGIYYVAVPPVVATATRHEGWIAFGVPPANRFTPGVAWEQRWIRPEAGTIVLFPSYVYHMTVPTGVDEDRLCVAFDVLPLS